MTATRPHTLPRPLRPVAPALAVLALVSGMAACAQDPASDNTATRPEAREGAWLTLHQSFLDRARQGDVGLLFLGDSITQGWANRGDLGPTETWDRYYAPRRAANFGIGGDRTENLLWRIDHGELDGIAPAVVVLLIGTNNLRANTPAETAEGVKAVVGRVRRKLPDAKVLLLGVFPRGVKPDAMRERIKALNERLARLDDGRHVVYLDLGPKFVEPNGTISPDVMADALHLTRKGYQIWAEGMEPTLRRLLGEDPLPEPAPAGS